MPAAAVIPALLLNQTTVAVKKFVVAFDMHMCLYNLLYFHMCMYECAPTIHVCVLLVAATRVTLVKSKCSRQSV